MCGTDIFLAILAVIFPPVAVWIKRGICSADSFINLALCILGFVPGLIHAWYIVISYPDPTYEETAQSDAEQGRAGQHHQRHAARRPDAPEHAQGVHAPIQSGPRNGGYGATDAGPAGHGAPPTYAEAVKGDNKVQQP